MQTRYLKSFSAAQLYSGGRLIVLLGGIGALYCAILMFHFYRFLANEENFPKKLTGYASHVNANGSLENIIRHSWFGISAEDQSALAVGGSSSLVDFELRGVSLSDGAGFLGAYIAKKSQPDNFYKSGDALPDGAGKLKGVFSDHVTINQHGVLMTLAFSNNGDGQKQALDTSSVDKSPFYALPAEKTYSPAPYLSPAEIAKRFVSDPAKILSEAGLQPITKGHTTGYLFNGEDRQGVFQNSGVQKDDIILAVNGKNVGDPKSDRMLAPQLALSHDLKLNIERDGQHIVIDYSVPR